MPRTTEDQPLLINIDDLHPVDSTYLQRLIIDQKPGTLLSDSKPYYIDKHKVWVKLNQPIAIFERQDKGRTGYTVNQKLGAGGFGSVNQSNVALHCPPSAKLIKEKQLNVIKFQELPSDVLERNKTYMRLKTEAELLHKFSEVRAAQSNETEFWIVNELHAGKTLEKIDFRRYSIEVRVALACDLCALVGNLRNIVHSDIKPQNILYDPDSGKVQLIDFGVAAIIADEKKSATLVAGTPLYMDPEAYLTNIVTEKTDIYSLAPVLAMVLGSTHERVTLNKYLNIGNQFDFSELDYCLPDWLTRTSITYKEYLSSTIKVFLESMTAHSKLRPKVDTVQHFFNALNRTLLTEKNKLIAEFEESITVNAKKTYSREMYSKIQETLHAIKPRSRQVTLPSEEKRTASTRKSIASLLRCAPQPKLFIEDLIELTVSAAADEKQMALYKQEAKNLVELQEEIDRDELLTHAKDIKKFIAKMENHEFTLEEIATKLTTFKASICQYKEGQIVFAYNYYRAEINSALAYFDILPRYQLPELVYNFPIPHFKIIEPQQTDLPISIYRALPPILQTLNKFSADLLHVRMSEIKKFAEDLTTIRRQYRDLQKNLTELKTYLTTKLRSTNSSGIKQILALLGLSIDPLTKLSEITEIASAKSTGNQWYSRSHIFGRGRHANVDTLYTALANLRGKSLAETITGLVAINATLASDREFVHQPSCCFK